MLIPSPCKINIGLQIYDQRSDGFHNLESLFYPIPFYDWIEILPSQEASRGQLSLIQLNPRYQIPEEGHLLHRAYQLLLKKRNLPSLRAYHYKQIPPASGLAGGSANAVALLRALNQYLKLQLHPDELYEMALELGSDCPFFLQDQACMVKGRGEKLFPASLSLTGYYLILLYSGLQCNTASAFSTLKHRIHRSSLSELLELPMERWKYAIQNDFEDQAFNTYPELEMQKEFLYQNGAIYASMSGSGSVVYGIFRERPQSLPEASLWHGYL